MMHTVITHDKQVEGDDSVRIMDAFEDFLKRSENTLRAERVRANKGSLDF